MLRFFEPETEPPRWMVSAAPRDLRLPPLRHYPYESRVSGSAAAFPLLSSASGSRQGASFKNTDARPPSRNAFGNIRECCSFVYSEDCDSFQLQPSARPVPTNPLNCTPGIRSTFVNPEAANSRRSIGVGCTPNAMKGKRAGNSNIEKSDAIELDSKRQKATVCMASSDVPESSQTQSTQARGRGKRSQKLGDRVTALQQLVSPFGKTDTASVLHEATIYIKTLHDQIQAFTGPHVGINSWLPLQGHGRERLSLRQRGLCLVPVSQIIIDPTHRAPFDHCNMERSFSFP